MYESKRRMNYWLRSNSFLCPGTYIFYSYSEALDFARSAELPIVSKTDAGYGAQGVRIFKKRSEVVKHVKKCFSKGVVTKTRGTRNIEKGSVFFQEYLPDVTEWRMVRIGESYFAHQKLKKGEFHSGSGRKGWFVPPRELLDFVRQLTDSGGFTSMNIDVFETVDNRFLVNELQTLFGSKRPYQMVLNGQPGRYLYVDKMDTWRFEKGDFCQNLCCNLRVHTLFKSLGFEINLPEGNPEAVVSKEDIKASIEDYAKQFPESCI
jgi:hypothetical protein